MSADNTASEVTYLAPVSSTANHGTFNGGNHVRGLSSSEAAERLHRFGANILDPPPRDSLLKILLTQMQSMMFLLTTVAAIIFWLLGDRIRGLLLLVLVLFMVIINSLGEWTGQDAGAALVDMASSPPATVMRDGKDALVNVSEIVVGDVVRLRVGDVVPADLLLMESIDLRMNEATLTGEAYEVKKSAEAKDKSGPFLRNMVYSSTSVVGGSGWGEVVAIGMNTQIGYIANRLKTDTKTTNLSPLQKSINALATLIACIVLFVTCAATLVGYVTRYQDPLKHCAPRDEWCVLLAASLRALTMAIAIIPHGLPFVVMLNLRVGSKEMAKRNAAVTKLTSVDYLSATTAICTDKTGTLTEGTMAVETIVGLCREGPNGTSMEPELAFYPIRGLSPNGGIFSDQLLKTAAKARMDAKFDIGQRRQSFGEPGLPDYGVEANAGQGCVEVLLARANLACGFITSYATTIQCREASHSWTFQGNMTEAAVKVAAAKGGYYDDDKIGAGLTARFERDARLEVPFSSERKMMATVHLLTADHAIETLQFSSDVTHFAVVKGAPDRLIEHLAHVPELSNGKLVIGNGCPITRADKTMLANHNARLAKRALRSLLLAVRPLKKDDVDALKLVVDPDERLSILLHSAGCFLGLWGIYDPPRTAVPPSIAECHAAGIRVIMVTGDQHLTAAAIGEQVGIVRASDNLDKVTSMCSTLHTTAMPTVMGRRGSLSQRASQTIDDMNTNTKPRAKEGRKLSVHDGRTGEGQIEPRYKTVEDMNAFTSCVDIWARAAPTDKVAIVDSLSSQGHVVAMTGDGVNDAPALKTAKVGVAMGLSGAEVTKNAADLILMDDNFSTIVAAIREGRRIYLNTQKYVCTNLTMKCGECLCLVSAIFAGFPMPMQATAQIMNTFTTHVACSMFFPWEEVEDFAMHVPPRDIAVDYIVPPAMWLFRWLPGAISLCCVALGSISFGVWMNTGFLFAHSLVPSSRPGDVESGLAACERAGVLGADGFHIPDAQPFHCTCHMHTDGLFLSEARTIDQWGTTVDIDLVLNDFDPWTGDTKQVLAMSETSWKDGTSKLLDRCQDAEGVAHWCWKANELGRRPLLPLQINCADYGVRTAQTMSYISIQVSEIMLISSYRRVSCTFSSFFSNPPFIVAFTVNLAWTCVLMYVPDVRSFFLFAPLTRSHLWYSLGFAIVFVLVIELFKAAHQQFLFERNSQLKEEALQRSKQRLPPSCWGQQFGPDVIEQDVECGVLARSQLVSSPLDHPN